VVVVSFRRPAELRQVLEALENQQAAPPFEVIVMDNDPARSGEVILRPYLSRQKTWRYEKSMQNNVSIARNVGAGLSRGEWLAFLDDDCVPPCGWLASAEKLIRQQPNTGLLFSGGVLPKNADPTIDRHGPLGSLPPDQYLLEGNLFFQRSEYLGLGGMRADLGPAENRFGYHEGSELQDRHLKKFGAKHRRLVQPGLAVRHLEANRLGKSWRSFLAGLDAARAFSRGGATPWFKLIYQVFKLPTPLLRLPVAFLGSRKAIRESRVQKEMYRLGEITGEIGLWLSAAGNKFSSRLRLVNNRLLAKGSSHEPTSVRTPQKPLIGKLVVPPSGGWMAGKLGTTELLALEFSDRRLKPAWPKTASWQRAMQRLHIDSGVFPPIRRQFDEFLGTYRKAAGILDAVCAWQTDPFLRDYEEMFLTLHCPRAIRVSLMAISTEILGEIAERRWLVVSPFVRTMEGQASRLAEVHRGRTWAARLAGAEKRCTFLRCPTFSYLEKSPFANWTEGLERLAEDALRQDFEVALIGAGAWSLPLAARLKQAGRVAIHLGGETQLVFGIKGQRWEGYDIYNEHWVRPLPEETPAGFLQKENGCYW